MDIWWSFNEWGNISLISYDCEALSLLPFSDHPIKKRRVLQEQSCSLGPGTAGQPLGSISRNSATWRDVERAVSIEVGNTVNMASNLLRGS